MFDTASTLLLRKAARQTNCVPQPGRLACQHHANGHAAVHRQAAAPKAAMLATSWCEVPDSYNHFQLAETTAERPPNTRLELGFASRHRGGELTLLSDATHRQQGREHLAV